MKRNHKNIRCKLVAIKNKERLSLYLCPNVTALHTLSVYNIHDLTSILLSFLRSVEIIVSKTNKIGCICQAFVKEHSRI